MANQKAPVGFSQPARLVRVGTLDVFCLQTLFAGDDVEDDLITFIERSEALALNSAIVDEYVLAGFLCDETETMFVIEPFNFAAGHSSFFSWLSRAGQKIKRHNGTFRCVQLHLVPHTPQVSAQHK